MAATSQQMSQTVGGVGAQGDLEQGGVRRNISSWLKMLHKGLRSFISVMPDAMDTQRAVCNMNLEYDDDALFSFSKAFITAKETELEIVYPNLQPILILYDKNASGDRSHLDAWFPDLNRKKLWGRQIRCSTFTTPSRLRSGALLGSNGGRTLVYGSP